MVIVINSVIGGFILAASTVRLQVSVNSQPSDYTVRLQLYIVNATTTFEEIVMVMIEPKINARRVNFSEGQGKVIFEVFPHVTNEILFKENVTQKFS